MSAQVLVVEDEPKIADLICKYLNLENFRFRHVTTGEQAIEADVINSVDLILPNLGKHIVNITVMMQSEQKDMNPFFSQGFVYSREDFRVVQISDVTNDDRDNIGSARY